MPPKSQRFEPLARIEGSDDAAMVAKALAGDREAFGALVSRYAAQTRRVARSVLRDPDDADDAAQDAFLSALSRLDRYDAARPFGPWLMRIVTNAALDRNRRRTVRRAQPIDETHVDRGESPDHAAQRGELASALRAALAELPARQRLAVVLFDAEGYSHAEVAEILGVPEGTARSDVFHARRGLRERLAGWKEMLE